MAQRSLPGPAQDPPPQPRDHTQEMLNLGREIRAAQNRLLEVERLQTFAKDDSAPLFGAITAFCGVMWRLTDRWATMIEDMRAVVSQQRTLKVEELSKAAAESTHNVVLSELIRAMNVMLVRRQTRFIVLTVLGAVGCAALLLGLGLGLLFWWLGAECHIQNGASVCAIWLGGK